MRLIPREIFVIISTLCSNSKKDKIINEKDKVIADLNTEMGKLQAEVAGLHAKFASNNTGLENTKKILEREITIVLITLPAFTTSLINL